MPQMLAEAPPAVGILQQGGADANAAGRITAADIVLALPLLAALSFIGMFSTAMPLTDEWLFLRSVIALERIPLFSYRLFDVLPYRIYDHHVIIPFLFYWPIAELSNFDNRALLAITVAVWIAVLFMFRIAVIRSAWWTIPVAVIVFSPARYMEFLWGFQFTLALSILFPVAGLVVLSRIGENESLARQMQKCAVAILLIVAGTLSSAGGFFGFFGAIVLLSMARLNRVNRLFLIELITAAMAAVYFLLMRDSGRIPVVDIRNILFILTALGSAIIGMPDAFRDFGLDIRSILGAAVVLSMIAAFTIATRRQIAAKIALPAAIFAFGLCSVAAIAVAREYLGNWHLVYAIPAVAASYAACYITFRESRSPASAQICFSSATILLLAVVAYYNAFIEYGPAYNGYIRSIEQYARSYLANPAQQKPFPGTGGWDLDANMVWFLESRHHAVFAAEDRAIRSAPRVRASGARVTTATVGNAGDSVLLIASLPAGQAADALVLSSGSGDVVLRKTDPGLIRSPACQDRCFTGLVRASALPADVAAGLSSVTLGRGS